MNIKKSTLLFIIILLVVIVAGVSVGILIAQGNQDESEYSAVYLATGDIYFGKLSWLPSPHLTNVWIMQRGVDEQNQPQFGIAPFKGAVWGPTDRINFNPKEMVFWTRLRSDSQIAQAIENPASLQAGGALGTEGAPGGQNFGTSPQVQSPTTSPQGNTVQPKKQ